MVVVTIDAEEARVVAGPDLVSRGVFYLPESEGVIGELKAGACPAILGGQSAEASATWRPSRNTSGKGVAKRALRAHEAQGRSP